MNDKKWIILVILFLILGLIVGISVGVQSGERKAFENLGLMFEGSTINVNFNETYIMDRTEKIINETTKYIVAELNKTSKKKK